MKKNKTFLTVILALALTAALLMGCAPQPQAAAEPEAAPAPVAAEAVTPAGVLYLKVNPEIALHYDENGNVTKLEAQNPDAVEILKQVTGYEGKQTQEVLEQLVQLIGEAGYLVEEAEGKARRIVLELDPGSQVPHDKFLEDMAAHVKKCVENTEWVGEVELEYEQKEQKEAAAPANPETVNIPEGLCPICGDDDCNDGQYCDDAEDLAENLREYENRQKGIRCEICGEYDCDDGEYCDDADELQENLREEQPKPTTKPTTKPAEPKPTVKPTEPKATEPTTPSKPAPTLCPVCGDDDCDDGKYCDDADELEENLREQENKKNGVRCPICGDDDCDDGEYCDDADELEENLREEQPKPTKPAEPKPTEPKETEPKETEPKPTPTLCPICGDDDCDDGEYCDDADELEENLREQENKKNGVRCPICGDDDCDDGEYCDDADELEENLREAENKKNGVRCKVCGDDDCDDGEYCDDWDDDDD